ncbi:MAG: exosortase-associated EpsI family protein [Gemmataceae bacterium]
MRRDIGIIVGTLVILGSGVVHGLLTSRWVPSEALQEATSRIPRVPLKFDDWVGNEIETDPEEFAQAGAKGYWMREYRSDQGDSISVVLMCGPGGRMAVHTPEVCYRGLGFEVTGNPRTTTIVYGPGNQARFKTAVFRKGSSGVSEKLRLFWGWGSDGNWQAPWRPRWTFGSRPALYKLYVIQKIASQSGQDETRIAENFFQKLLPVLDKTLFFKMTK